MKDIVPLIQYIHDPPTKQVGISSNGCLSGVITPRNSNPPLQMLL